ncbi:MAG: hypothetical protein AAGI30_13070 [Planctomycetota bacterium]
MRPIQEQSHGWSLAHQAMIVFVLTSHRKRLAGLAVLCFLAMC